MTMSRSAKLLCDQQFAGRSQVILVGAGADCRFVLHAVPDAGHPRRADDFPVREWEEAQRHVQQARKRDLERQESGAIPSWMEAQGVKHTRWMLVSISRPCITYGLQVATTNIKRWWKFHQPAAGMSHNTYRQEQA